MKADKLINADNRTVSKLLNHEKYRGFLNPYYQWSLSILKGYTLYDVKDMASRKRKYIERTDEPLENRGVKAVKAQ